MHQIITPSQYITQVVSGLKALYPDGGDGVTVYAPRGIPTKVSDLTLSVYSTERTPERNIIRGAPIRGQGVLARDSYHLAVRMQLDIYIAAKKFTEDSIEGVLGRIEFYIGHEQYAGNPLEMPRTSFGGFVVQERAIYYEMTWVQALDQEEYHEPPQLVLISEVINEISGPVLDPFTVKVPPDA